MKILVFLSLLPVFIASWRTKFDFIATLKCDLGVVWCANLWYQEIDPISNDDYGKVPLFCTDQPKVTSQHIHYDATDGMFNNNFEPAVTVTHNCTNHGYTAFLHELPDVSIFETYAKVEFEFQLTN